MKDDFNIVLRDYNTDTSNIVNSSEDYYRALVKDAPEYIGSILGDRYVAKGSCGQGNKALNPWICIFDKNITSSATYGLYVCYLFRSDMTGFYLALSQGITTFKERFGSDQYSAAKSVASYFQRRITDDFFSKEQIDLRSPKGTLGYGYEMTTILSKFYSSSSLDDKELHSDLKKMIAIYRNLASSIGSHTYDAIVNNAYENQKEEFQESSAAIRSIESTINETEEEAAGGGELTLIETLEPKRRSYRNITSRAPRKIDYLKKAESDGRTGLKGEKLVLDYERNRIATAGRADLVDKIEWVAEDDDTLGYDISSFDIGEDGGVREIQIEVKTTKAQLNEPFFLSDNELRALQNNPENYRIYRVSIKKDSPALHIIRGNELRERFSLTPCAYLVSIKEDNEE